jgi:cell division protein ZapB
MSDQNSLKENTSPSSEQKTKKFAIIIALLSIVVIIQGVKIYLDYKDNQQLTITVEDTQAELQMTISRLDDISQELDEKIAEISELGGDIQELEEAKADLEKERNQLQRTRKANRSVIAALQDKAEGYEELLKAKDKEIEKLKDLNQVLYTENTGLKNTQNQLSDSISSLSKNAEKLASKVEIASQLEAENIQIVAISDKQKERSSPFRSRHIDKLKVIFGISENKVAPIEGKEIMIRVIDSNGQVLFDVSNGSGTFMLNDKEAFFTATQEILFDNSRQLVTFLYDKGSEYNTGAYTMEIYTEDYLMGTGQFIVK